MSRARSDAGRSRRAPRTVRPLRRPLPLALMLSLLACAACRDATDGKLVDAGRAPTTITAAGRTLTVELQLTQEQRNRGLMGRTHLDADAGMLFIFPDDRPQRFWMKDTLIPLDIIFLDKDGTVQNVADALPGVEQPGYFSLRPARMVLELNEGWCAKNGLKPGDRVIVPEGLLALAKE